MAAFQLISGFAAKAWHGHALVPVHDGYLH
jgi:hypothetical protein